MGTSTTRLPWRGQRGPLRPGRWAAVLAASVALHVPLTPLGHYLGLGIGSPPPKMVDLGELSGIPFDVTIEAPPEPAPATPEPAPAPPAPDEGDASAQAADAAAAKEKAEEEARKKAEAAAKKKAEEEARKKAEAAAKRKAEEEARKAKGPYRSPLEAAGKRKYVDTNANVQLLIHLDVARRQHHARRLAKLLRESYQWRSFFGPAGVNAVEDIDRVLLIGPQFRRTDRMVVVVRYNVPQEKLRGAVNQLIAAQPDQGGWQPGKPPTARAYADRGVRSFVFSAPHLLVVAPRKLEAMVRAAPIRRLSAGKGAVLSGDLRKPHLLFRGMPLNVATSISRVQFAMYPRADGGVRATFMLTDDSPEKAEKHAQDLQAKLSNLGGIIAKKYGAFAALGAAFMGLDSMVENVEVTAKGSEVHGKLGITRRGLGTLLDIAIADQHKVRVILEERDARARAAASASSAGPPAPSPSPGVASPGQPGAAPSPPAASSAPSMPSVRRSAPAPAPEPLPAPAPGSGRSAPAAP